MSVADTQQFYGRWARAYDWLCRFLPGLGDLRRRAVDALELERGDTVVDLGCGTGANLPHLRDAVGPEGTVVGVDLTPGMLAEAGTRVERAGWENVHLALGDAARPPVDDADAILGTFVVGMLDDPAAGVRAWRESVLPGGRIAVLEAGRTDREAAGVLNRIFDRLVAAGAPGGGGGGEPSRTLDERIDAARDALAENGGLTVDERRVAGFVRVFAGHSRS
ncbi:class I SAM-dependent methyltransferase [Halobacterium litoreum]|uniref:Class I SAM-dependent methyltransferase n=1 Tax=Halobacterium litoreum TaxID=2039234 RepID=A0ABD5NI33_9EURY|nr:methyltransferase domain-containing protein [Halobacterium litoreum]UHH12298.1 methyltransferase domain-containing protein [Halobacterium litoreum]